MVIGLTGLTSESGGFTIQQDRVLKLEIPTDLGDCEVVRRDFELLAGIAGQHPESLNALHKAAIVNDVPAVTRIANEIGLTEDRFAARGGGIFWAMIALAGAGLAYAAATGSGSSEHAPGPSQPPPEETVLGPSSSGSAGGT